MNDESFPKFQWSKFVNGDRGEQFVVRSDTWEDLITGREKVISILETAKSFAPSAPTMPDVTPVSLGNCRKCGALNAVSKAGKVYCTKTCWLGDKK